MKRHTYIGLAIAALCGACRPAQETAPISGRLTDAGNDTLIVTCYPVVPPDESVAHSDTLVMQSGAFSYTPADSLPQEVTLTPKGTGRYYALMFVPGETVRVSGSPDNYRLEGSAFNALYQQQDSLFRTYSQCRQYIGAHPDSDVSLYLLSRLLQKNAEQAYLRRALPAYGATLPPDHSTELAALFKTLGKPVQNGAFAPLYRYWDEAFRRSRTLQENRKSIAEGLPAPDFTLNDTKGNAFTLSTLRGKYVVLDFWGSWCGPCLDGMPRMKKCYDRYRDRLEIVGIACHDTKERWQQAVADNHLPWTNVLNANGSDAPDVGLLYAVESYPTKIIIDPTGKMLKITTGERSAFYEYLDKLFN